MQCDDRGYCSKALKKISKDYRGFKADMERALKLLGDRFCPMTREEPVKPGKLLHRVTVADTYEVWKFSVAVAGSKLRPSQWPRLWFGVVESSKVLVPLVAARHKEYDMDEARFDHAVPSNVMVAWMASTFVEVIGILWVITRSLFPFNDAYRDRDGEKSKTKDC